METLQHGSWVTLGMSCPQSASIHVALPGTGPMVAQAAGAEPPSVSGRATIASNGSLPQGPEDPVWTVFQR